MSKESLRMSARSPDINAIGTLSALPKKFHQLSSSDSASILGRGTLQPEPQDIWNRRRQRNMRRTPMSTSANITSGPKNNGDISPKTPENLITRSKSRQKGAKSFHESRKGIQCSSRCYRDARKSPKNSLNVRRKRCVPSNAMQPAVDKTYGSKSND